ncbi:MAG TPA: hypothetical protein VH234_02870 [Candidatus Saccharimonadales bacterium]|nr:hypothetical protein [Candidatus Saccharimonadales bacterium]
MASNFIIHSGTDALWDSRSAWLAGFPAYFWNQGIVNKVILPTIKPVLPPEISDVTPQSFNNAAAVRHAAISLALEATTGVKFAFHNHGEV